MIPDNQRIVLKRIAGLDKYKNPVGFAEFPLKARVTNEINRTTNQSGEEVVTSLTVLVRTSEVELSGAKQLLYSDKFSFTDEFGNVTSRVPQNISPARGFGGTSPFVRVLI